MAQAASQTRKSRWSDAPNDEEQPLPQHSLQTLVFKSVKRTHDMFLSSYGKRIPDDLESQRVKISAKIKSEYEGVKNVALPAAVAARIEKPKIERHAASSTLDEDHPPVVMGGHAYPSGPGVALT
eukprot:Colp12_sorted_trinity150504_noHs@31064